MTDSTLAGAQQAQIATITAACAAAITGGLKSAALGSPFTYPTAPTDQQNLHDAVLDALLEKNPDTWTVHLWCASERDGMWSRVPHNIGQAKQLARDGAAARVRLRKIKDDLVAQVNAATTVDEVSAIVWPACA